MCLNEDSVRGDCVGDALGSVREDSEGVRVRVRASVYGVRGECGEFADENKYKKWERVVMK